MEHQLARHAISGSPLGEFTRGEDFVVRIAQYEKTVDKAFGIACDNRIAHHRADEHKYSCRQECHRSEFHDPHSSPYVKISRQAACSGANAFDGALLIVGISVLATAVEC